MRFTHRARIGGGVVLAAALWIGATPGTAHAQARPAKGRTFAQQLVETTATAHPEADEIGISVTTRNGCVGIASTDKSDVGEKCEADDVTPMTTGKPSVGKEEGGYDVSFPLRDKAGTVIGVVGIGFKAAPGQTTASVTELARKIAAEMAAKIPSKATLFTSVP
jgi:hypothetical protein